MITLTLAHDRHLSPDPNKSPTAPQCYHWSRALSSFNKQLCHIPQGDEPAALLTTAAMLGLLSFSNIEATTPEEAWPLAPHSPSDLDWLMMSDGKKEVWKLTQQSDADPQRSHPPTLVHLQHQCSPSIYHRPTQENRRLCPLHPERIRLRRHHQHRRHRRPAESGQPAVSPKR